MRALRKIWIGFGALGMALMLSSASHAQALNSGPSTVTLNATLAESLTLGVSPNNVTFTLVPSGTANGNSAVTITTSWVLAPTRASVNVYAYFTSTTALADTNGDIIPTSSFNGSVNGGTYSAFTGGTGPFGANSKTIYTRAPIGAGNFNASHTDTLGLQISTSGLNLPAGTYTGILNIQAQAI